jgi:hypothetical protein
MKPSKTKNLRGELPRQQVAAGPNDPAALPQM